MNITIDDQTYEVDVEVSEPEPVRPVTLVAGQARMPAVAASAPPGRGADMETVADESKVCRSPVNGLVTQVVTHPDQVVQIDDVLLVLEAMKMETKITAPVAATVAKVNVTVGDAVRAGQVLVEFA
ncbi:biotin/lipoyl-binding protein [Luedemannella flava]|uniref:Biotin/lipoyl-binding protein n=1 Tax=Luedemannella flava TaxID=349316 RepID=A0ABN2LDQ8_9ACTN